MLNSRVIMRVRLIAAAAVWVALVSHGFGEPAAAPRAPQGPPPLDQLLAPIALYPDQLLAQILLCATDPASVTQLDTWLKATGKLKGSEQQDAAIKAGFEASFVALVPFPQVVAKMAGDIKWTTQLGQAFNSARSEVFASIQKLRKQAQDVGTLKDTAQQDVSTKKTSSGQDVIVIEPSNPQVVYVPQYNATTIYTTAPTTTVVVQENDTDAAVAAGLIGFTAGIAIGAAFDNDYYYGPYGWRGGAYMYDDAWDDYFDAREDAREDWQDHREDLVEERGDRAGNAQEQRTERAQNRQENRPDTQSRDRSTSTASTTGTTAKTNRTGNAEARGYGDGSKSQAVKERSSSGSGRSSDAFSGYSSGKSERASSARGKSSRSSSRGGGGGGGRRR